MSGSIAQSCAKALRRARQPRRRRGPRRSGIVTSTRRGEATSRALIAVIAERRSSPAAAPPSAAAGQHDQADQPEGDQRPVQQLPARLAHHVPRPVRPDPPDLRRDEPRVLDGSSVTSSQSCSRPIRAEGLVGFHPGSALRPAEPGSAPAAVARPLEARTAPDAAPRPLPRPFPDRRPTAGRCRRRAPARLLSTPARTGPAQPRCAPSTARPRSRPRPGRSPSRASDRRHPSRQSPGEHDQAQRARRRRGTPAGPAPAPQQHRHQAPAGGSRAMPARRLPATDPLAAARKHRQHRRPRAASPPAARPSASPGTRAAPGRWPSAPAPIRPASGPGEPPPDQVGEEHRQRADQGQDESRQLVRGRRRVSS